MNSGHFAALPRALLIAVLMPLLACAAAAATPPEDCCESGCPCAPATQCHAPDAGASCVAAERAVPPIEYRGRNVHIPGGSAVVPPGLSFTDRVTRAWATPSRLAAAPPRGVPLFLLNLRLTL